MMQRLNKMFDGDWLLTVAAYNSGEGRVMKAMKVNKARGKPTDFWSLPLPQETKLYVPKMLALSEYSQKQQTLWRSSAKCRRKRALARVRLDSPVEIAQLADMAGMPVSKLKTFNAGVKGSTLGATGPKYVMVPQKHADQLR
ncbi:Membrane-bound lytic murein transglycosylase D precursor [Kluyvera cryocrescens]|uniref:Membrane-bound lytic murein transglycosylase D n=1 Tax=Kluyvera cryocrescens TaxID=580 RepID=A0A485AC53_KLUCR|nr:Membrane-bound lytic murein transglycosylase D precursor [Kluyvera cryocrescens]